MEPSLNQIQSGAGRKRLLSAFRHIRFSPRPFRSCLSGGVIFWVVAGVVQGVFCGDVFVNVVCFDLKKKAVCVFVQELALGAVLLFQFVVEKVIHQDLAVVKDRHPGVNRFVQQQLAFVHVDSDKVV